MDQKSDGYLSVAVEAGLASLTLSRPSLNVMHIPMLRQLQAALDELVEDTTVRVLVLRAEGKMFSAGVDVADHTEANVGEMIPLFDRICRTLADFPTPTLAVVHGHALGGGCELVLCCDLAVMAEGAKIGQPEIQLATLAPIAALRLPQLVGYRATADMMFTGRVLDAQEALQMGLVNAVVPPEKLADWVDEKVGQLLGISRAAMVLLKRGLKLGMGDWAKALPAMENLYLEDLMNTADVLEGVEAFMEKRSPVWKHK